MTFSTSTVLSCGLAARLLNWRPRDFWSATPAELVMALQPIEPAIGGAGPSRELIAEMLERDTNG